MVLAGSPPPATTPARRCRRSRPAGCAGPSDTGVTKGCAPQRVKLRRCEAAFRADQQRGRAAAPAATRGGAAALDRGEQAALARPVGQQRRRAARGACSSRHGQAFALLGRLDGDGGEAVWFTRCALLRSVMTGSSAATPSSVAFCTTRSVASRFSSANTSQRSGSARLRRAAAARHASWRGRAACVSMRAANSPSRPLNSSTASPGRAAHDVAEIVRLRGGRGDDVAPADERRRRRTGGLTRSCRRAE